VTLALAVLFGALGSGYLVYGKRESEARFLVAGFILIVYPYFVSSAAASAIIGILVAASPFLLTWLGLG
jgi:hypothetical protein